MYLSDRDLLAAIKNKQLIVDPPPNAADIGATSIDLHLDSIDQAKVWNIAKFKDDNKVKGLQRPELHIGKFNYPRFSEYLVSPPNYDSKNPDDSNLVLRRGSQIIVKPHGFLLWITKEIIGTPKEKAKFICFVDGKSTRARTGLLVHLTAPTIHAKWSGQVVLEIANLGPFDFILEEGDVIAQITVAKITSVPLKTDPNPNTKGQRSVHGRP